MNHNIAQRGESSQSKKRDTVTNLKTNQIAVEELKRDIKAAREQFKKREYFTGEEAQKMFQ